MPQSLGWSKEHVTFLSTAWGNKPIPYIAEKLERSINAVKLKAQRLKLGRHLHCGKEVTFNQLCIALGQANNYKTYKVSWPNHGLQMRWKKSVRKKFAVILIEDFWKWAKDHKSLIDFSKFPKGALGEEPGWAAKKRQADKAALLYKTSPWTEAEDNTLITMLNEYRYGYREISERLRRTEGALKRRMRDLNLKQRPLRADNHTLWEQADIQKVKLLHLIGFIPEIIAGQVNRSGLAVRGLIERLAAKNALLKETDIDPGGTHYQEVLPRDMWPKAERFLRMLKQAKEHAVETGCPANVDLRKLRKAF